MNKELVKSNFSRYAHLYDSYAIVQKEVSLMLKTWLPENIKSILELGCGTGIFTKILVEKYPESKIVAVDLSSEMVEVAKKKIYQKSSVNFILNDIENLSLLERFDLVTSNATLQWLENLPIFFSKIKNYLNENGKILFSLFGKETYKELRYVLKKIKGDKINLASESFLSYEELKNEIIKNFEKINVNEEKIIKKYNSLYELLKTIKYTGTRGKGLNFLVSPSLFYKIEKIYLENFGTFYTTYQIFIVEGGT